MYSIQLINHSITVFVRTTNADQFSAYRTARRCQRDSIGFLGRDFRPFNRTLRPKLSILAQSVMFSVY
jgi:hypothetical protein